MVSVTILVCFYNPLNKEKTILRLWAGHTELGEGRMWPKGHGSCTPASRGYVNTHVSRETNSKTEGTHSRQETSTRRHWGSRERRLGDYVTSCGNGGRARRGRNCADGPWGQEGSLKLVTAQGGQARQNEKRVRGASAKPAGPSEKPRDPTGCVPVSGPHWDAQDHLQPANT